MKRYELVLGRLVLSVHFHSDSYPNIPYLSLRDGLSFRWRRFCLFVWVRRPAPAFEEPAWGTDK